MDDRSGVPAGVEAFIQRVRALTDDDLVALADARAAIDETFHVGAWRAATEIVAGRGQDYLDAWVQIGSAFIPDRLEGLVQVGASADPDEVARWQTVARIARIAIDEVLLAHVAADLMRPPDLRELHRPWQAMQQTAHDRMSQQERA